MLDTLYTCVISQFKSIEKVVPLLIRFTLVIFEFIFVNSRIWSNLLLTISGCKIAFSNFTFPLTPE